MKLYVAQVAPNPTKVMMYIAEREALGVTFNFERVDIALASGEHRQPEYLARNPFGTVPMLELDDGTLLLQSLSIMDYFDEVFEGPKLEPIEPAARAKARDIERIVDVRLSGLMARYGHAVNSPIGYPPNPEVAEQLLKDMQTPLDYLEDLLSDKREWLCGNSVTKADCSLQAHLHFLRFLKVDVLEQRQNLIAWNERHRRRETLAEYIHF